MSIIDYYDSLASQYDNSRFSNSYGKFIDSSEKTLLDSWLKGTNKSLVIDFGCGTGRHLEYAMTGLDGSEKMLEIAAKKFPDRTFFQADISRIPPDVSGFEAGLCFHVFMHMERRQIQDFLAHASKVILPGGRLIVDFMSAKRRRILNHKKSGWHGNTDFTISDISELIKPHWAISRWRGIVLIPIHRLPPLLRPLLLKIDGVLCKTILSHYASYYIVELRKMK